ncbi:MAG: class I SAM-dependent methyltransferase [Steroidobacteraceae bacterium]
MPEDRTSHWQTVYSTKQPDSVSWFAPHLGSSLDLLKAAGLSETSRVIDVGAGASTLIDDLLDFGVKSITALDISEAALAVARSRLGDRASQVQWLPVDILKAQLSPGSYDLWHDRAALHFLTDPADAARYVEIACAALANGGHAVIGGFGKEGPTQCSQLPVTQREPEDLARLFGPRFSLVQSRHEIHQTPWGSPQSFAFAVLRKIA